MKINPDQAPDINAFSSLVISAINDTDTRVDGINGSTVPTPSISGVAGQDVASQLAYIWNHVLRTNGGTSTGEIAAPNFRGDLNGVSYTVSVSQPTVPTANDIWFDVTNRLIKFWDGSAWSALGSSGTGDGSVTTAKIADNAVTAAKIADGAVTAAELADNSVATGKLADGAVTQAKLDAKITIPFANIASKPATAAGYGITDAVTLAGGQTIAGTLTAANFSGKLNGSKITVASAAPAGPVQNDLWIDTASLSFKYFNGTTWTVIGTSNAAGPSNVIPVVGSLGTASSANRGQTVLLQGTSGAPDGVYICMRLGNGSFDWVAY